jgi:zinc transport system substrate-binding protein
VADLASQIAGPGVRVEVLLPPGESHETFEPTARQMARLSRAAAYVFVGGGMDAWAERLAPAGAPVLRVTEGIRLLEEKGHGEGETGNPHVWLDPVLVRDHVVPALEAMLARLVPDSAGAYRARAAVLADSLTALDAWVRSELSASTNRSFISTHTAWTYFARRYDLHEIGAVYESPGREPTLKDIAALIDEARALGTRAVFTEPQLGEAGPRAVALDLGADAYELDSQGRPDQPGRDGYLPLMRFNTQEMVRAFGAPE